MATPRLEFKSACLPYSGSDEGIHALRDFSLAVEPGESVAVIGPSGCGKSTMLMLAAGLLQPTSGQVLVNGEPVGAPRQSTALILQDLGLLEWKTVEKNVALGLKIRGVAAAECSRRAREALDKVGLSGFERRYPAELSGGMRQRVAFARAVALDADLLLADEPLSALDAISREELQDHLLQLQKAQGYSFVLVTHDIDEAVLLGRRIVVMTPRPGRLCGVVDNPGWGAPDHRFSAEFSQTAREVRALLEQAQSQGGAR